MNLIEDFLNPRSQFTFTALQAWLSVLKALEHVLAMSEIVVVLFGVI